MKGPIIMNLKEIEFVLGSTGGVFGVYTGSFGLYTSKNFVTISRKIMYHALGSDNCLATRDLEINLNK
jgi:hypothetical protein